MKKTKIILLLTFFVINVSLLCAENNFNTPFFETDEFVTDVTHIPNGPTILNDVTRKMKTAGYWISKLKNPDKVILTEQQIQKKNSNLFRKTININNIANYPDKVKTAALKKNQKQILRLFTGRKYIDTSFKEISKNYVQKTDATINLPSKKFIPVKYAMTISYCNVRLLPTDTKFLYDKQTFDIDRAQVAALDIGEPLIVLHQTKDKKWTYVISLVSEGWIKTTNIAFTNKQRFSDWINAKNFVIVTEPKTDIYFDAKMTQYFDYVRMATKLPIINNVNKQITCVKIPQKSSKGNLIFKKGYIYTADINNKYLQYTQRNVLLQAFKHLNSPYSWGGYDGEQDCSTFIRQVFGCFGFILPRNSLAQIYAESNPINLKKDLSDEEKSKEIINKATSAISLLYLPGHIMIYIGQEKNKPYIIHAIWGTEQLINENERAISFINRVVVSSLMIGYKTKKGHLLKRITKLSSIK